MLTLDQVSLPDEAKVKGLIKELFHINAKRGWILMSYTGPNTVSYTAHGTGPLSEVTALLKDDQMQYFIVRVPLEDTDTPPGAEIHVNKIRDASVAWTGPKVGLIEKGKKKSHLGAVQALLTPVHAQLYCTNKANLTEKNLKEKSDPKAGSHIID